jgi:hypothetical protein
MHSSYERLLEISLEKPIEESKPADIARKFTELGFQISSQQMGNWKSRGVPSEAIRPICRIAGVIDAWLASGEGPKRGGLLTSPINSNTRQSGLINTPPDSIAQEIAAIASRLSLKGQLELYAKAKELSTQFPVEESQRKVAQ